MNIAEKIGLRGGIFSSVIFVLAAAFAFLTIPSGAAQAAVDHGFVDNVQVNSDNTVRVSGWAYDPDNTAASVQVRVYIDGAVYNTGATDVVRNDIQTTYGLKTNLVGYDWTSPTLSNGDHSIQIYAIDYAGGDTNPMIYNKVVTVSNGNRVDTGITSYGAFRGGHTAFAGSSLTWTSTGSGSQKYFVGGVRMSGTGYIGYCAGQYGPATPIEDGNSSRTWGAPHAVTSWHGSIRWIGDKGTHSGTDIDHLAYIVNYFGNQGGWANATSVAIDNYLDILYLWPEEQALVPISTISGMWWNNAENQRGPYYVKPAIKEVNAGSGDGLYTLEASLKSSGSKNGQTMQTTYTAKIFTSGDIKLVWDDSGTNTTSRTTGTIGDVYDLRFHYVSGSGTFFVAVSYGDVPDSKLYVSNSPLRSTWYGNAKVLGNNYGQDMFITSHISISGNSNTLTYDIPTYDASGSTEVCVGDAKTCDPTKETDASGNDLWTKSAKARVGDTYFWRVSAKNLSTDSRSTIAIASNVAACSKNYANAAGTTTATDAISPNESTYTLCGPLTFSGTSASNAAEITTYAKILNSTDGAKVGNTTYAKSTTTTNTATVGPHTFNASIVTDVCTTGTNCVATSSTGWASTASFKKDTQYTVRVRTTNTGSTAPILGANVTYQIANGTSTTGTGAYTIASLANGATDTKTFTQTATFPDVSSNTYTTNASFTTNAASGSLSGSSTARINRIYVYGLSVAKYVCAPGNNCETGGTTGWATSATLPYGNTNQMFKYVITNKSDNNVSGISVADSTVSAGTTSFTDTLSPGATKTVTFTNTNKLTTPYTSKTTATLMNVSGVSASASATVNVSKTYDVSITKQVCVGDATACPTGTASVWSSSVSAKRGETVSWKTVVKYTGNYDPVDLVVSDTGNATCSRTTSGPISAGSSVTITCTEPVNYDTKTAAATVVVADRNNASATLNTASASATVTRLLQAGYKLSTKACVPDSGRDCSATSAATNWSASVEAFAGNAVDWKVSATNSGELGLKNLSVNSLLNNATSSNLTSCNISGGTLAVGASATNVCATTLGTSNQNVKSTASTDISK